MGARHPNCCRMPSTCRSLPSGVASCLDRHSGACFRRATQLPFLTWQQKRTDTLSLTLFAFRPAGVLVANGGSDQGFPLGDEIDYFLRDTIAWRNVFVPRVPAAQSKTTPNECLGARAVNQSAMASRPRLTTGGSYAQTFRSPSVAGGATSVGCLHTHFGHTLARPFRSPLPSSAYRACLEIRDAPRALFRGETVKSRH